MSLRVIKGNPWHTPRNRRPVCRGCAKPACDMVPNVTPTVTLKRDGSIQRGMQIEQVYYCPTCGPR